MNSGRTAKVEGETEGPSLDPRFPASAAAPGLSGGGSSSQEGIEMLDAAPVEVSRPADAVPAPPVDVGQGSQATSPNAPSQNVCAVSPCHNRIADSALLCKGCWRLVPKHQVKALSSLFRPEKHLEEQSAAYERTAALAVAVAEMRFVRRAFSAARKLGASTKQAKGLINASAKGIASGALARVGLHR